MLKNGAHSIAEKITVSIAQAYDQHMVDFLRKHKIPVDPRNLQGTLDKLAENGYKVVVETEHAGMQVTTYRFYLTKMIDMTEFKVSYDINING